MQKSEDGRFGEHTADSGGAGAAGTAEEAPDTAPNTDVAEVPDRPRRAVGYQALADFERWASLGASAPELADRLAAAGAAAAAYHRLVAGPGADAADALLDTAERRVQPDDWWEALAKAYHWQRLTAEAYGIQLDDKEQSWARDRLAEAARDQAVADRLTLVERRLKGEALVLEHALGVF